MSRLLCVAEHLESPKMANLPASLADALERAADVTLPDDPAALQALAVEGWLLGRLVDESHLTPPTELAQVVARECARAGLREVRIYLQDYEQQLLIPLPVAGADEEPVSIAESLAGRAFIRGTPQEHPTADGVTMWLPMLDGTDRVGVLELVAAIADEATRRLARRVAGLVADLVVTKGSYTDSFFRIRRARGTTLSAEMQWHLLPPLTLQTPSVAVAGVLEPAYDVGGDAFDYALNDGVLHIGIFDAMGHGLGAATLCAVAVGAYRHARRNRVPLEAKYQLIDAAVSDQFGDGRFATAQLADLDVRTGRLRWINAGHPRPLLVRDHGVVHALRAEPTLPLGLGGENPDVGSEQLEPGDRVLFFTDGVVEQLTSDGEQLGFDRLRDMVERESSAATGVAETTRRLSSVLLQACPNGLRDDATLLLVEWKPAASERRAACSAG